MTTEPSADTPEPIRQMVEWMNRVEWVNNEYVVQESPAPDIDTLISFWQYSSIGIYELIGYKPGLDRDIFLPFNYAPEHYWCLNKDKKEVLEFKFSGSTTNKEGDQVFDRVARPNWQGEFIADWSVRRQVQFNEKDEPQIFRGEKVTGIVTINDHGQEMMALFNNERFWELEKNDFFSR